MGKRALASGEPGDRKTSKAKIHMAIIESLPFSISLGPQENHAERFLPHFDVRSPAGVHLTHADEGVVITDLKWASYSYMAAAGLIDPHLLSQGPVRFMFDKPKFPQDLRMCLGNISRQPASIRGSLLVADKFTSPPIFFLPLSFHHDPHPYPWKTKLQPGQRITMQARPQVHGTVCQLVIRNEHARLFNEGQLHIKAQAFSFLHPQLKKNIADPNTVRELPLAAYSKERLYFKNGQMKAGEVLYIEFANKGDKDIEPLSASATMKVTREPS